MNNPFDRNRLIELVGFLCDEIISDQQFNELEQILQCSAEARRLYHICTTMASNLQAESWTRSVHSNLTAESAAFSEPGIVASPIHRLQLTESEPKFEPKRVFPKLSLGRFDLTGNKAFKFMLAVVFFGSLVWFGVLRGGPESTDQHSFAQVLGTVNVVWEVPTDQCSVGELVQSRRLTIQRGIVHVRFNTGANVAIEGPADFEILNENKGFLHKGQIAVYVPTGAEGFCVDTPQAEVIDLGTEFGLSVDSFGESQVHVFSGEVEYLGHADESKRLSLTAGLAVAVDDDGISRPVELKERSFEVPREVLWMRYRYSTSISSQFIAGNTTDLPGGVPGRIGGGWTGEWMFDCVGGEVERDQTLVRNDRPLGDGLDNYLDVSAKNASGGSFGLKVHRGFDSMGEKFDCRENYIVQFLMRINSDVSKIHRIKISDSSFDQSTSKHAWRLTANRIINGTETGELKWRGLPLRSFLEADELVPRKWSRPDPPTSDKTARLVVSGCVYRVVVEVQPNKSRYRISLSDGEKTLVGDWTKDIARSAVGDRLERRLEWLFEADDRISVSFDSIRIQNDSKFD